GGQILRQQAYLLGDDRHMSLEGRPIWKHVDVRDLGPAFVAEGVEREDPPVIGTDGVDHPRVEPPVVLEPPVLDLPRAQINDGLAHSRTSLRRYSSRSGPSRQRSRERTGVENCWAMTSAGLALRKVLVPE